MQKSQDAPNALDTLAPPIRGALTDLSALLRRIAEDNLVGLTVFGPAMTVEFNPSRDRVTTAAVFDKVEPGMLRRIAEFGPDLGSRGLAAPMAFTPGYLKQSLDTFPLELMEIQQLHATVAGRDFFTGLDIQPEHLRLQCERELKRVLIRMNQTLLEAGTREDILGTAQADIGQHLLRTLRGVLWLRNKRNHLPREQALAEIENWVGGRLAGARSVILSSGGLGWPEFQAFYADVEKLAERTDAL